MSEGRKTTVAGEIIFHRKCFVIACLLTVLVISQFALLSNLPRSSADTSTSPPATATTTNLLQYEWPQFQGDSSFSRFSAGSAPEAPDIMWKTNITKIQSYVSAFNGKVFVASNTSVYALNPDTGAIIWSATVPAPGSWPATYKIDQTHMVVGSSCFDIDTGKLLWTSSNFSSGMVIFNPGTYSPEEKMFFIKTRSYVNAWNFSDPSKPPTLAWSTYVEGGANVGSGVQYGDGKVFTGSYESHQMALDAKTGKVLWDTETKAAMLFAGTYYEGKYIRAGSHDNTLYAFDANTGKILWTYNPQTQDGYFCTGTGAAYNMVYELNKDGFLYAVNAETGQLVWKYEGPGPLFFPGNPVIADGKIYATTGQRAATFPDTMMVHSQSEFVCLDAFNGQVIWRLPIEAYAPRESIAIAYGNLYFIPGFIKYEEMDEYDTLDQVWAIGTKSWPQWRLDAAHSAIGQSGPANMTLRWQFMANGSIVSSPSQAYGRLYFGSQDKNVYCIDALDGSFYWTFATKGRISSTPAVVNSRVYIGPDDGSIYCLDAYTGNLIWTTPAGGFIPVSFSATVILRSSPAIVGDSLYVGALDNNTYCVNTNDGTIKWTYQTKGYITSSPAVSNGIVYVTSQEPAAGVLYALNASNGSVIWKTNLPYLGTPNRGKDMMASPCVGGGLVFVPSNKQAYYAVNATTGVIQWTYKDPEADEFIICTPTYKDGKVYLIDQFIIVCVNATDGQPIWQNFLGKELYVSPTVADDRVYVATDERLIYVLDANTGAKISFVRTASNIWSAPITYNGRLYVGINDWNLNCYASQPAFTSSLCIALDKQNITVGESIGGKGQLAPSMPNKTITINTVKPDGTTTTLKATTNESGIFNFSLISDSAGMWNITATWKPDNGYYAPSTSNTASIEAVKGSPSASPSQTATPTQATTSPSSTSGNVSEIPTIELYLAIILVVGVAVSISGAFYFKVIKKPKPS